MIEFVERVYAPLAFGTEALLGADIGGTNSNFGFFTTGTSKPLLLLSLHTKSQTISDFQAVVQQALVYVKEKYNITVHHALFACAGVVSAHKDRSKPTNLSFIIDAEAIKKTTGLCCVYMVNDFEVIGYGLELIDPASIVCVNKGSQEKHAQKAILGAGTGLGKCIMFWNHAVGRYVPVASEGGHADAALQSREELDFAIFIKHKQKVNAPISWEDLLSGNGIRDIYAFFHATATHTEHTQQEQVPPPDEIFARRNHDAHSKRTLAFYTTLYARCAKNFALDALARGGVYIAGGIAARNAPMFNAAFMKEFINCTKQRDILAQMPVHVITDYNVSLYGAAYYLQIEGVCKIKRK